MKIVRLPGLIDVHTHLRVPGGEHKEDFASGSAAALAGGITMILGMPNTSPPLCTPEVLLAARQRAAQDSYCDVGLFAGACPALIEHLPDLAPHAAALKIYLNDTFGQLRVEDVPTLRACFQTWPHHKLIAMHAEKQSVAVGIGFAAAYNRPVHFCHISRREEIELIADAKAQGLPVTCEVTPHHLFLTTADAQRLGPLGDMRPLLGTPDDVAALWDHLSSTVDCIATDHAPHTLAEKYSATPPPGVAGLETSLPLMLTAVQQGRLTLERLIELMHTTPRRLFNLPEQPDTWVDVDVESTYLVKNETMVSKCGWTPFAGWELTGKVEKVVLRGRVVVENGLIVGERGGGRLLTVPPLVD
ncbi:MAG: amidohydrolase family protein [Anaerolineae bacterium]|nr:amidohydrolase family protein [Anaerolineae bacterium]